MVNIVAISGSLRRGSYNSALLRAAAALAPADCKVDIETIEGIPLYHADEESKNGVPAPVKALQDRIAAADGLLVATPEYNNSIPGVLKNAIDWLSRPPDQIDRVFRHCPVGIIGASPGGFGTVHA
ncbi:MAG: NADPH-dependent FMN reductase, partial [Gammaproteobacteria bacterium]|nr:NADPH-dependent FMN reductase [Gammaproteobacteria bacterium]